MEKVKLKTELLVGKVHDSRVANCEKCGEAFKMKDDPLCPACRGGDPYMNQ